MIPRYSQACIDLAKESEGLVLSRYKDAAGFDTCGYGHKCLPGETFQDLTQEQSDELLIVDLHKAWVAVNDLVKVNLTQGQVDALVDFCFNLGQGNLAKSTLLKLVNQGDFSDAALQFSRWSYAGAVKLPGLVTRRERERQLFLAVDG